MCNGNLNSNKNANNKRSNPRSLDMKNYKTIIGLMIMALILVFVVSCDDDDENGVGPVLDKANVRVIHASYDAPLVDIHVDGTTAFSNLEYGTTSGYASINSGTRNITVTPAGASTPVVIDVDLTLATDAEYTVFAVGALDNIEPIFDADTRTPIANKVKIRVVHASPDAPAVDLKLDSGAGTPLFSNLAFKDITSYIEVDPGTYTFAITPTGSTDEVVVYDPISVAGGQVFTVMVHGSFDNSDEYPLLTRVFIDNNDGNSYIELQPVQTNIRLIHTSYDAGNVDLLVDGGLVASNVGYPLSSGYSEVNSGLRNITVTAAGTTAPAVVDLNLDIVENLDYTIFALDEVALIDAVYVIDDRTPSATGAKVRLVHASPDAPAVDVKVNTGSGTAVFTNSAFKDVGDYIEVSGGTYTFVITPTGSTDEVVVFDPVDLAIGSVYTIVAHGTLDNSDMIPFGVRVFVDNAEGDNYVDLTPAQIGLRVIHTSYDAPDVDVWVDGATAFTGLAYGISSGYADLNAGTRNIVVTQTGTTEPAVIDVSPTLEAYTDYTVFAIDQLSSITAVYAADDRTESLSAAKIRMVHAVPDAPAVDLKLNSATGTAVVENVAFSEITDYAEIADGDLTFVVTAASATEDLYIFEPVTLVDGNIYTVVAHGTLDTLDSYPFGVRVFIDNGDGINYVDLSAIPAKSNIRVIHTSYDASAVDVRLDDVVEIAALNFGQASAYTEVNSGLRNIVVTPAGAAVPEVIDIDLMLQKNFEYTILAVDELALIDALYVVDDRTPDPSSAKVRFIHAIPDAPAVDIKAGSGANPAIFGNKVFKDITDYISVVPDAYSFVVTEAGSTDELVVFELIDLEAGGVYTIVAYGTFDEADAVDPIIRVFDDTGTGDSYTDLITAEANLRVIHTSYDAPNVDIFVDDDTLYQDLAYGLSSGYVDYSAGTRNITVNPTGSGTSVIDVTLTLGGDVDYTIFAVDEVALIDAVYDVDLRAPVPSAAKVRFVHASPDAPAVDIRTNTGGGSVVFGNTAFKDITSYAEVTGGSYSFVVTAAGDTNEVFAFEPVTLTNNTVYTVVAHGTLDDGDAYPFGVRVFIDNDDGNTYVDLVSVPLTAKVRMIHTSYDAPDVDVWIDGAVAYSMLPYGGVTGYTDIDAGTRNIQVTPAGLTVPVVVDVDLTYVRGNEYTAFAVDEFAMITAVQTEDDRTPNPNVAKMRLVHASPDAPAVDLKLFSAAGTPVFENIAFKDITAYNESDFIGGFPFTLVITATGSTTPVATFENVNVNNGSIYTIVVHGTLDDLDAYPLAVRVFVDDGDGDTYIDLVPSKAMAEN